jgi:hypothetical protein
MRWRACRRRWLTPSSTSRRSQICYARHTWSRSPSAVGLCLSEFAIAVSNGEVRDSTEEEYEMIMAAVEGVCTAEWRSRRAIGPFAVGIACNH